MPESKPTVKNTFSILVETDEKLERMAKETFLRLKGNVIDLAVDELWKQFQSDPSFLRPKSNPQ